MLLDGQGAFKARIPLSVPYIIVEALAVFFILGYLARDFCGRLRSNKIIVH